MILINLLPDQYRKRGGTPIKLLAGVAASVAVNGSLLAWWAWTAFGVAAEVKSDLALLKDTKQGLEPQVAYHKDLEKESKVFDAREATLKKLTGSRVSWTRKIDELIDVINQGGDGDKYLIWLDDLSVEQKENPRNKTFGKLKASGHSGSAVFANVANFLDDVEAHRFSDVFNPPASPEGSLTSKNEDLMPSEIYDFPFELTLKSPDERKRP